MFVIYGDKGTTKNAHVQEKLVFLMNNVHNYIQQYHMRVLLGNIETIGWFPK